MLELLVDKIILFDNKIEIYYKFDRRMRLIYRLLDELGVEKQRVQHDWISASEGEKFASTIRRVTSEIQELGPSPLKAQLAQEE